MRPTSPIPVYLGIALTIVGFLAIALAWGVAAGEQELTSQLPLVAGGGLLGIGVILVGLTLTAIQSRRIEGAERVRQVEQVAASVAALREVLLPTDDDLLSTDGDEGEA